MLTYIHLYIQLESQALAFIPKNPIDKVHVPVDSIVGRNPERWIRRGAPWIRLPRKDDTTPVGCTEKDAAIYYTDKRPRPCRTHAGGATGFLVEASILKQVTCKRCMTAFSAL